MKHGEFCEHVNNYVSISDSCAPVNLLILLHNSTIRFWHQPEPRDRLK